MATQTVRSAAVCPLCHTRCNLIQTAKKHVPRTVACPNCAWSLPLNTHPHLRALSSADFTILRVFLADPSHQPTAAEAISFSHLRQKGLLKLVPTSHPHAYFLPFEAKCLIPKGR